MKKLIPALLSLVFMGVAAQPVPEIIHYKFDGTGSVVPNFASSPPASMDTGYIVGTGLSQGNSGKCGKALVGTGATSNTDYINTGWKPNIGGSSFTISFWCSSITPSSTLWYIFGEPNTSSFRCFTNGVAAANNWMLRGAGLTDVLLTGGATMAPTLNTFVYDSAAKYVYAYRNDTLVNSVAQTAPSLTGTGTFTVGAYASNSGLSGLMDEFRFYKKALTLTEIKQLLARPQTTSTLSITACKSYKISGSKKTFTQSGTYSDTIPNSGCGDSIITLKLTIKKTSSSTVNVARCYSYTIPSGAYTFTQTGTYKETITNSVGCDSVVTYFVTIHKRTYDTLSASVCTAFFMPISNRKITTSGIYYDTTTNVKGCDSIVTVQVKIRKTTTSNLKVTACNAYWSPSGKFLIQSSGNYKDTLVNSAGCDSIISIQATIKKSTSSTLKINACYQYTSPSKTYTWTKSGTYMDKINNQAGCDSVITIQLTIQKASSANINPSACRSYVFPSAKHTVTQSGNYIDTILNAGGCDSILFISLTITQLNKSISQSGTTLTVGEAGAQYQWVDCGNNQWISGATSQSYTATANGNYKVIITGTGCKDTSVCAEIKNVKTVNSKSQQTVLIYPNPSSGNIYLKVNQPLHFQHVRMLDLNGKIISIIQGNEHAELQIPLTARAGIYILQCTLSNEETVIFRIEKK